eukprot:COSAG05_NODE_7420_length_813_cov_0.843137_2_plen_79_part_00
MPAAEGVCWGWHLAASLALLPLRLSLLGDGLALRLSLGGGGVPLPLSFQRPRLCAMHVPPTATPQNVSQYARCQLSTP